ncbi:TIR domain-containing protein [Streptomyces sp. NPDC048506]|uniref:toll/interleukin-1 receptor domain-containing protein n=1 Tax=Streptomyces sp. NPDC048506 TaxID=3155028 RepID=UPI0034223166
MEQRPHHYDVFISYSHQRDIPLAEGLEDGFAAVGRERRFPPRAGAKVFRDTTSLAASSDLSGAIKTALAGSRYFVYLASPEAAASPWVRQEITYWLNNRSLDRFLIALSAGTIAWDESASDFDWSRTTALPDVLRGAFATVPLWVDFRKFREAAAYDVSPGTEFRDRVVTVAAPVHGLRKDELDSKDLHLIRLAKRRRSWARIVASATVVVMIATGVYAWSQSGRADAGARTNASQALAARSLETAARDPRKAAQFALYAYAVEHTGEAAQALGRAVAANDSASRHLQAGNEEVSGYEGAGHSPATNVTVSRDGSMLAYYSGLDPEIVNSDKRGLIHLYDIRAHKTLPGLRGSSWPQDGGGLALSHDGRLLAVEAPFNQIEVWDVPRQKLLRTIVASDGGKLATASTGLRSFAFSGDGKRLAATFFTPTSVEGEPDFHLAVWDASTGHLLSKESVAPEAFSLAFDTKHRLQALDSRTGRVRTLSPDSESWTAPRRLSGFPPTDVMSVTLSDDGARAYLDAGSSGGKGQLWDLVKGRRLSTSAAHALDRPAMPADSRGSLFAAGSSGQEVAVYDAALRPRRVLGSFGFRVRTLSASGDGTWVAAGSSDGAVSLFSTSSLQAGTVLQNEQHVKDTELTPDHRLAFRAGRHGTDLWTVGEKGIQRLGHIPWRLANEPVRQDGVIASRDGTRVVVAQERMVSVWDPRTGTQVGSPRAIDRFTPVSFLPDDRHIIAMRGNAVTVMDPRSGQIRQSEPFKDAWSADMAVSADRTTLAVLDVHALSVYRWSESKGLQLVRKQPVATTDTFEKYVTVSRNGGKVAVVNKDKRLSVLDVASGRVVHSTAVSPNGQMAAAFSEDSAFLVQAYGSGRDAGLQFWDTASGDDRGTWEMQGQNSGSVGVGADVFAGPEGSLLAFGADGSLVRRTIDLAAWREILCTLAPDPLPAVERERYLEDVDVAAPCGTARG